MKKDALKRTVGILIFWGIFLLIFQEVNRLLRLKPGVSDRIYSYYQEPEDSLDVLFFGSSHSYYGLEPMELWGEYGVPSYIVGSANQSLATTYYLVKDAIRQQHPKVIVIEAFLAYISPKYTSLGMLHRATDSVPFGKNRIDMINDILEEESFEEKLLFYLPFIQYHSRWDQLEEKDYHGQNLHTKGGNIKYSIHPTKAPDPITGKAEIPENSRIYADKIIQLCKEENVEVMFFLTPYADFKKEGYYQKQQEIYNSLEEHVKQQGVSFINYGKIAEEIDLNYSTDLKDVSHLNTRGALKLSRHLFAYLMENYDLKSRKREKAYEAWDNCYQLYRQDLKLKLEAYERGEKEVSEDDMEEADS